MKPSNDNSATATKQPATQAPLRNGHETESVMQHQSEINYDANDGFGNAQWDTRAKKRSVETVPDEEKMPPAF